MIFLTKTFALISITCVVAQWSVPYTCTIYFQDLYMPLLESISLTLTKYRISPYLSILFFTLTIYFNVKLFTPLHYHSARNFTVIFPRMLQFSRLESILVRGSKSLNVLFSFVERKLQFCLWSVWRHMCVTCQSYIISFHYWKWGHLYFWSCEEFCKL